MRITTFNNGRGLIHGSDPKRIGGAVDGVLKIGKAEIAISQNSESILPILSNGGTGEYDATFTDICGRVYNLDRVTVQCGRIEPPSQVAVDLMELRCRAAAAEAECERLRDEIRELKSLFDTNSLNFLIK